MSDYQENLPLEEAEETIVKEREEQPEQFDGVIEEAAEVSRETYDSLGTEKYEATDKPAGETAVAKVGNTAAAIYENENPTDRLMMRALELNNVEALERIIALKQSEEDRKVAEEERQNKLAFDRDFAIMQTEFEPVKRTKENKQYNSKYAELSDLQIQYGPIISKHGFAYSWEEVYADDGSLICTFLLSKHGYTKRTPVKVPAYTPATGNSSGQSIMNPMQAVGTQLSYGHRYSMKGGLGVTETGEDTDGNLTFQDSLIYAEYIARVTACKNIEQLKFEMEDIWKKLGTDDKGKQALNEHYKKKRAELQQGGQQ